MKHIYPACIPAPIAYIQLSETCQPHVQHAHLIQCYVEALLTQGKVSESQSPPDPIQIHLEPRVIQWDLPHLQRTATACTPSAQQSQSAHDTVVFTCFPTVWPRFRSFGSIMLRSSRSVPTTQAGGLGRPVDLVAPGGALQHAR